MRDTSLVYPVREDGAILLGRKRRGMGYGKWNGFGGKIEAGETHFQALRRELIEELGITIRNGTPWRTIEHVYPHAHVQLHFIIVTEWDGEPHGREDQALHWQQLSVTADGDVHTPETEPILPATVPLLADLAQL